MKAANIGDAKAHFWRLVKRAEGGEETQILRNCTPVARVVPVKTSKKRYFASDDGLGTVAEDFNEPLPPNLVEQFYK